MRRPVFLAAFLLASQTALSQQTAQNENPMNVWLPMQAIPNITILTSSDHAAFGFEWEATPLLYSFGINDQISPWYAFMVDPPARFTGSLELGLAGQFYTTKIGRSYFAYSVHLMGYLPLIEWGEHLTLNVGLALHQYDGQSRTFAVAGVSSIFGMLHLNLKHSPSPSTFIVSLEFRVF